MLQASLLKNIRGLIIDMDGVLWKSDQPLPGLVHFFEILRRLEIRFVLATNNNTQSAQGFIDKLASFGIRVEPEEILTASIATLQHLKRTYPLGSRVYVVGEPPLKKLISDAGYVLADQDVAVVVATMDRNLSYDMLKRATLLIRAGADFVAPNPDKSYPTTEGIVPGAGAVLAALVASSDREPLIIGKPEKTIYEIAVNRMGFEPQAVASLGDRLDTDIEGGIRCGLKTILVLSGVTTPAEADQSPIKPDWIFSGIDTLGEAFSAAYRTTIN